MWQRHDLEIFDKRLKALEVRSPQSNGICERFNRTVKDEFYSVAFRKKLYTSLEQLQAGLDEWISFYNSQRPHSGKYCYGKTPLETFEASNTWQKKNR